MLLIDSGAGPRTVSRPVPGGKQGFASYRSYRYPAGVVTFYLRIAAGLFLSAVAAFAALMGVGGASFTALYVAWLFVPAPFVYFYLWLKPSLSWLRPGFRPWLSRMAVAYLVASSLLTAALLFGVGWVGSERAIHPSTCDDLPAASEYPDLQAALQPVEFHSKDGTRLAGWLAVGSRDEAVILLHGYRCTRQEMLPHADMLHGAGFTVVLFDLRNRGESEGEFVSFGFFEQDDALAAVDYLKSRDDLNELRIGMLGISQGGVAAVFAAAASEEVLAVVAEAPFRSVDSAVAQSFTYFIGLPAFPFAPITVWLAELRTGIDSGQIVPEKTVSDLSPTPVLIIHGLDDETISPGDSEVVFAAAGEPKELWLIPGAGHGEGATAIPDEYRERIVAFFEDNL